MTNQQKLIAFAKENYLAIVLGFMIFISLSSFVLRIGKENLKNTTIDALTQKITANEDKSKSNSESKIHLVKRGDTLWSISKVYYDSGYSYMDIATANKITNPNQISVGTNLVIPPLISSNPQVTGRIMSQNTEIKKVDAPLQIKVVKNDTLWAIAERTYGSGFEWKMIAKANKIKYPKRLMVGQLLILPSNNTQK